MPFNMNDQQKNVLGVLASALKTNANPGGGFGLGGAGSNAQGYELWVADEVNKLSNATNAMRKSKGMPPTSNESIEMRIRAKDSTVYTDLGLPAPEDWQEGGVPSQ